MTFEYMCPLCTFIITFGRTYTHFRCPSCTAIVQAIPYNREKPVGEVEMPPTGKGDIH